MDTDDTTGAPDPRQDGTAPRPGPAAQSGQQGWQAWQDGSRPGPQPGAQAGPQGWQPPQPSPEAPVAGSGFFSSVRNSGWFRAEPRVVGGVCSGIAAHTGWDVGLLRAMAVILGLFLGPIWIAYGAAWALLPEQRDGRIHLEQLTRGHYDIAQLGALIMVVVGLGNAYPWFLPDGSGWFLWTVSLVVAVTVIVTIVARGSRGRSTTGATGPAGMTGMMGTAGVQGAPGMTGTAGHFPGGGGFAATSGPGQAPHGASADGQHAAWQMPTPTPDVPGPTGPWTDAAGPTTGPSTTPSLMGSTPTAASGTWYGAAPIPGQPDGHRVDAPAQPNSPVRAQASSGVWAATPPSGGFPAARWTPPAPPTRSRRLSAGVNVAVLGVIVLLVAASLFFTFIAPGTDPNSVDPVAIGCGVGLIVVGLVMGVAAVRDRGAGWMVALSLVGVLIALPLMAIVPSQRDHVADSSGAQVGVQVVPSDSEYDWTTSGFSEVGDANLNLVGAPASTDKRISVDDTLGDLTVHVRQGQSVAFRIDGTAGEVSAQYYEGPGATTSEPWVPAVSYVSDALYFRSDGYRPGAAITVAISGSVGNITIIEEAPSTDTSTGAQSGGAQSGDPQSGQAQSGAGAGAGKTGNQNTGDAKTGDAKAGDQSKEDAR